MLSRCTLAVVFGLFVFVAHARADGKNELPRLELGLHGGACIPTDSDSSLSTVGFVAGIAPLVRVSSPFSFGLLIEHSMLGWRAEGAPGSARPLSAFPDDNGSMSSTLVNAVGRWYIIDAKHLLPYLQLAFGFNIAMQAPEHPDCSLETFPLPQLALGLDYRLLPSIRVGASVAGHLFALGQSCNDSYYEGKPPNPPFPGFLIGARLGLTTVWSSLE